MKKILVTTITILFTYTTVAQDNDNYKQTLQKMFEVSGSKGSYNAVIKQMFSMFKEQYPTVEENIWVELEGEFTKTSIEDLTEMLVPVYSKYLTIDDLNGLIAFYQTDVGKKYAKNTPLIMQESMQIGQQWGMKIGQEFQAKMKERGY